MIKPRVIRCRYFDSPMRWGVMYSDNPTFPDTYTAIKWRFESWREAFDWALALATNER